MVTLKIEIQRIRMTFEHHVYDFDDEEEYTQDQSE